MTSPPPYLKVSIRHCFVFLALVSNWQESLNLTKMKTSLMKFSILLSRLRFFNFFQFVTKMPNIFHVWQDTLSDIDVLIGPIVTVLFVFYRVTGIEWTVLHVDTQQWGSQATRTATAPITKTLTRKTTTLFLHHTFCYISVEDVINFSFYFSGTWKRHNSAPGKFGILNEMEL